MFIYSLSVYSIIFITLTQKRTSKQRSSFLHQTPNQWTYIGALYSICTPGAIPQLPPCMTWILRTNSSTLPLQFWAFHFSIFFAFTYKPYLNDKLWFNMSVACCFSTNSSLISYPSSDDTLSFSLTAMDWMFVSPKINMLNLIPGVMVFESGAFRIWLHH